MSVPFLDKPAIDSAIERAQRQNLVFPVPTELKVVEDCGVKFYYQIAISLIKKSQSAKKQENNGFFDPFDNPPQEQIAYSFRDSPHKLVLNRFNVVSRHLLLVTNQFEHQLEVPNHVDLDAIFSCITGLDSIVTFNCGTEAGASQPHKHYHVLPRPLIEGAESLPLGILVRRSVDYHRKMRIGKVPELSGIRHAMVPYRNGSLGSFLEAFKLATSIIRRRHVDSAKCRSTTTMSIPDDIPSGDMEIYDECFIFIATHDFIFVFPRSRSAWSDDGSSFNSISCTGCYFFPSYTYEERFSQRHTPIESFKLIGYPE